MGEPLQNRGNKSEVREKIDFFEKKALKTGSSESTIKKTHVQAIENLGKTEQAKPKPLKEKAITPAGPKKTQPRKMTLSQEKKQTRAKSGSKIDEMKERFERTRGDEIKPIVKEARPLSKELNLLERFPSESPLFRAKAIDLAKKLIVLRLKAQGDTAPLDSLEKQLSEQLEKNKAVQQEVNKLQSSGNSLKAFELKIEKGDNFDTLVSQVLDSYGVKSQDIPGPDKEQGQLSILNRIAISESEGYPTGLIMTCEKVFHQNTGKQSASVKLNVDGYRFKIIPFSERGKLLVEIQEIFAEGSFKKNKYAGIYGEPNTFASFITAKPKDKTSAEADTKKVEKLRYEDDLSFETSTMPINRMNLQMLEREKGRIHDDLRHDPKDGELNRRVQQVEEKIRERKEAIKKIDTLTIPSEREEYENEIKLQLLFKGEGVQDIRKVVSLQDGRKIMVQKMAGYGIDDEMINDLAAFSGIKSERKLEFEEKKALYQALYDSFKGLERMHQKGYIHRDVKPDNTLISSEGRGLLSDFGTAIPEDDPQKYVSVGTPQYRPPEAVNWTESDMWSEINTKWDVWSAGMMITDLALEGQDIADHPIFLDLKDDEAGMQEAKKIDATLSKLRTLGGQKKYNERLQEFRARNSEDPIVELIIKCTQIDPDDRPSMTEVKEEFKKIIENQGIALQ